ncbi:hypothetical protein E3P86_03271 [Wallemia ichthyophaga]|uniref:Uncharacterized protein n=1 Tax=Wallemia ichthyophaga TaxID=245174 RepID=A0A4T0IRT3_WALIC|nr:hypothetical protein E3P86_03271 [Wallemia ichthyophaga]
MDKLHNIVKQIDRNDENVSVQITAIKNLIDQIGSLQDYAGSFEETQFGSAAMQLKTEIDNTIPRIQDVLVQNDNLIQKMMDLFFVLDAGPHLDKLSQEFGRYQETHLEKRDLIDEYNMEQLYVNDLVAKWPQDSTIKQLSSDIDELSSLFANSGL